MKNKRIPLVVSVLVLGGAVGNLMRTRALDSIRTVDALTLVAAGMALGVLIFTLVSPIRKQ